MKVPLLLSLSTLLALPVWAADLADEVKAAAQTLAEKPNYSWTAKTVSPQAGGTPQGGQPGDRQAGRGRGRFGGFGGSTTTEGKADKSGFMVLTFKTGTNRPTEVVVKGEKVAIKEGDEWKTSDELGDGSDGGGQGRFGRGQMAVGRARRTKAPATDAQDLVGRVKELKKEGDVYSGEMTAEAIKSIFSRGGQRGPGGQGGGTPPDTSGLKGTVKFWVKDGTLSKYESHIEGKRPGRNNTEIDEKRTTTVEIKDIGSTKVAVPAEAKKKLSA